MNHLAMATDYQVEDATLRHLAKHFDAPNEPVALQCKLLQHPTEIDMPPYIGVLRRHGDAQCDWRLYAATACPDDDGQLWFCEGHGEFVPLGGVPPDGSEADGYVKWDGCRQIDLSAHHCDTESLVWLLMAAETMDGLAANEIQARA